MQVKERTFSVSNMIFLRSTPNSTLSTLIKRRHSIFAFRDPYLKQMAFPLRKTRVSTFCGKFGSN